MQLGGGLTLLLDRQLWTASFGPPAAPILCFATQELAYNEYCGSVPVPRHGT